MCDGERSVAARRELAGAFGADSSLAQTWSHALVAALTEGVSVSVVQFPEDDPDLVLAYNATAHDVDSNRFQPTSLKDLVDVARRYQARTPGGDWRKVQNALEALYGRSKRPPTPLIPPRSQLLQTRSRRPTHPAPKRSSAWQLRIMQWSI